MIALFEHFVMRPTRQKRIDKKFDIFWTLSKTEAFECPTTLERKGRAQSCRRFVSGWLAKKWIWDELRVEKPLMEKNNWGTCVQILSLLRSQSQIFFFVSRKTCSFFFVFVIQMIIFFRRLLQFGFCSTPTWDTQVWQGLHRKPVRVVWRHGLERGLLAFF